MAHFARIKNNIVKEVIVVNNDVLLDENGVEQESNGIEFCRNLFGGDWIQTSYNGNFRKNYAGLEYKYDSERDAFIPPKPYNSWILNETTCRWDPPIDMPDDGKMYIWNENNMNWQTITP